MGQVLHHILKEKLPKDAVSLLPHGWDEVGDIITITLPADLYEHRKEIGKSLLKHMRSIGRKAKSVVLVNGYYGIERKPDVEVVAGRGTHAIVQEHYVKYEIDLRKFMFSFGNKYEKSLLTQQIKPNQTIIDMFAGIGYWTLPLAKNSKAKIVAIDINNEAVRQLRKNIKLNSLQDQIKVLNGDCREFVNKVQPADHVILGWMKDSVQFLPAAYEYCRSGGIIHYQDSCGDNDYPEIEKRILEFAEKHNIALQMLAKRKIKSIGPKKWHFAIDFRRQ